MGEENPMNVCAHEFVVCKDDVRRCEYCQMPEEPGTIEFASSERIGEYEPEAREFLARCDLDLDKTLITDETALSDFGIYESCWREIEAQYGIVIRSDRLLHVLAAIRFAGAAQ